jgi:glycosyltransferase involved in cell wall biosynthesis
MIIKNEENVIERSLRAMLPHVQCWSIVDTGSTDSTKEIIHSMTAEYGRPGTLYQRPWVNFEHNRNEALLLAKDKACYTLFIDADEELIFEDDFIE